MTKKSFKTIIIICCLLTAVFFTTAFAEVQPCGGALFQVSTLKALMLGQYDGVIPADEFLAHGDTGLGTVDKLDGEMITLDGVMYQIKGDGTVAEVDATGSIPFGVVTNFEARSEVSIAAPVNGMTNLTAYLDAQTGVEENPNSIYVVRIDGGFAQVKTRSVPAQQQPYPPLAEVTAQQNEFEFKKLDGTIVGVYFPDFFADFNMHGWHLHFLSADRQKGGHLLDATVESGTLAIAPVSNFNLLLPDTPAFAQAKLTEDMSAEIEAAEK